MENNYLDIISEIYLRESVKIYLKYLYIVPTYKPALRGYLVKDDKYFILDKKGDGVLVSIKDKNMSLSDFNSGLFKTKNKLKTIVKYDDDALSNICDFLLNTKEGE